MQGANWCSFASPTDARQQKFDTITYETWAALTRQLPPNVIATMPFRQDRLKEAPWFEILARDFSIEPEEEEGLVRASYKSHCINVPLYTQWLVRQLKTPEADAQVVPASPFLDDIGLENGHRIPVTFSRVQEVSSIGSAAAHFPDAALVINATGLGAGSLEDVKDEAVYPIAGQVVVAYSERFEHKPRCIMGFSTMDSSNQIPSDAAAGKPPPPSSAVTYVIPRARSGQVILGGSYREGCYDTEVDQELSEAITRRAVRLCPELLLKPPAAYGEGKDPQSAAAAMKEDLKRIEADENAWKQLKILSAHVGLRPARKGGIRIERQVLPVPGEERSVPVVHAYGIGPAGYQSSWGVAHEVAQQVKQSIGVVQSELRSELRSAAL